jgi:EAL domain-containing protein (putative c-di-GMP-specific phosphodiesterase class I)
MDLGTVASPRANQVASIDTGWYLTGCVEAGRAICKFPINSESFVIGRRPGVSLTLPSGRVSGRHAEILIVGEHLFIRDLGSTNGTFVNRRKVVRPTPIGEGDHIELADTEFRLEYLPRKPVDPFTLDPALKKTAKSLDSFEPDWILSQFEQLMQQRSVTPHFQPIIRLSDVGVLGFEALARSNVPGLQNPAAMFQTAQLVNREAELSRLCRDRAVETIATRTDTVPVFLNTHPHEDLQVDVLESFRRLRERFPDVALVVEIHEGAIDDPLRMHAVKQQLCELNVRLAYDDFGAGQSRLLELVQAPPHFLKFDACLVRHADRASNHQWKLLKMLVDMAHDFDTLTLAEGVETAPEAEACRDLGFDLAQGYFFGRPAPLKAGKGTSTQFSLQASV